MTDGDSPRYVLDSYAVLAWLQGETGAAVISGLFERAQHGEVRVSMSVINLGEVLYIIERGESIGAAQAALAMLDSLPIEQVDVSRDLTLLAAHYKVQYRMSYADCFGLALAMHLQAVLVTGDPEFLAQKEIEILWVGAEPV